MVTTHTTARVAQIALPDFGLPDTEPLLPAAVYPERLHRLREAMAARGYDHLVVWADREHSANVSYLTGFDPRFEEAVLLVAPAGEPVILVGNECSAMAAAAPLPMRLVAFQDLSLPGQPRDASRPLRSILGDAGIGQRQPSRRRRLEDLRQPGDHRGSRVPGRRAPGGGRQRRGGERHRPPDRSRRPGCA